MDAVYSGIVVRGHGMASGRSVGEPGNWFPRGTLEMQRDLFEARGLDLAKLVPELRWATINVEIGSALELGVADHTAADVDWTAPLPSEHRIAPETFSFVACRIEHRGVQHAGLLYYPHPETKPPAVTHRYDVLEVLTRDLPELRYGDEVRVFCRRDAFRLRTGSENPSDD